MFLSIWVFDRVEKPREEDSDQSVCNGLVNHGTEMGLKKHQELGTSELMWAEQVPAVNSMGSQLMSSLPEWTQRWSWGQTTLTSSIAPCRSNVGHPASRHQLDRHTTGTFVVRKRTSDRHDGRWRMRRVWPWQSRTSDGMVGFPWETERWGSKGDSQHRKWPDGWKQLRTLCGATAPDACWVSAEWVTTRVNWWTLWRMASVSASQNKSTPQTRRDNTRLSESRYGNMGKFHLQGQKSVLLWSPRSKIVNADSDPHHHNV